MAMDMAVRWAGGQRPGEVRRKGKMAKGPTLTSLVSAHACGLHSCARAACLHRRARERERAGVGATTASQDGARATTTKGNKEGSAKRRACVGEGGGTCKKSIPFWLDRRHHQQRRHGANDAFPLGSKAGTSSEEWGKLVLTSVATGRSAGISEEG
jgi:hypothetical protein